MRYLLALLMVSLPAMGQQVSTSISATITDTDSQTWNNGTATATFVPGPPQNYKWPGGTIPISVPATMNGSGTFTMSLPDNTTINPLGSAWRFSICPNASAPCVSKQITVSGSSMDLSTQLSSVAQGPRFPASAQAYGYLDVEISPLPLQGGFYWNVTTGIHRQWTGTVWQDWSGGGGGGGSSNPPTNSIQVAGTTAGSFTSDSHFQINPITHTRTSTANDIVNAWERKPRNEYDPMNTAYCSIDGTVCGLAAAVTAGGTYPTEVIQAAMNYGKCQSLMGLVATENMRIPLPTSANIPITGLKLWKDTDFGAYSMENEPILTHTDATAFMITGESPSATITCSNGTTYTPNEVPTFYTHDFLISGGGQPNTDTDIGIVVNGAGSVVSQIGGVGNSFGGPGIIDIGTQNLIFQVGYPAAQIQGCHTYTSGTRPVSGFTLGTGYCAAVQAESLDGEVDFVYASDGQGIASGHPAGPCYPNCAAFLGPGANGSANHIFAQISDIDWIISASNSRNSDIRLDAPARQAISILPQADGNTITNVSVTSSCRDTALQSAYTAGTATGCSEISDAGQGNQISLVSSGAAPGEFGPSFNECAINSGATGSFTGGTYSLSGGGNPQNATRNDMAYCGIFGPAHAIFASGGGSTTGNFANVSGISTVAIGTTPITHITGGVNSQVVEFSSISGGSSIVPGTVNGESISTCNGGPETNFPSSFLNFGGYTQFGGAPANKWTEICNAPQFTPMHIDWVGNPTPSDPNFLDLYGNAIARQIPNATLDVSQLHGSMASGSACFEEKIVFPDGSFTVTPQACTTINLAAQTAGAVFASISPFYSSAALYLVSNAQGNGVALGNYGPPNGGGLWDGPTTIAAGGDGSPPPPAGENYTGVWRAPFGLQLNTSTSQPPCTALRQGLLWTIRGAGSTADILQQCIETTGSAYTWQTIGAGGGGGTIGGSGTLGFVPLYTPDGVTLGNSHLDEVTNAGFETFTQGIIINDGGNASGTDMAEGVVVPANTGRDTLWANAALHCWSKNTNNTGEVCVSGIATPGTSGHNVKLAANGIDLVDAGTGGGTPTFVNDSGAGTGPTTTIISGATDFHGWISVTPGTSPTAGTGIITLIFGGTYTVIPKCSVTPANPAAAALSGNAQVYVAESTATVAHWVLNGGSTALTTGTAYIWAWSCGQ
jgi:hypothetical protein